MHKSAFAFLGMLMISGVLIVGAQSGGAAPEVDQDSFAQGEELFEANCAVCHQSSGQGNPPSFPALAGNENLQDLTLIVTTVHEGRGAMPAFPQFDADEMTALATYVRNAWENDFGGVTFEAVSGQLGEDEGRTDAAGLRSVWEGVYTADQAARGDSLYSGNCSACHGYLWFSRNIPAPPGPHFLLVSDPETGPALDGEGFLRRWNGSSVGALFQLIRTTMPLDRPGSLSDQEYLDIVAFLLAVNDFPAGAQELVPDEDQLGSILIQSVKGE